MKIKKKKLKKALNKSYNKGYNDAIIFAINHPEIVSVKRGLYNLGTSLKKAFGDNESEE